MYVSIDERTPPNPYLKHIPLRDIEASGISLTLMNPAYMLRQVMEEYEGLYGIRGHITSLSPLRPENTPDAWERSALTRFEQGVEEVVEFTEIEGEEYFRLMRPMVTAKGCLKCHGHQGYKEGDIRGGVSVSVPISTYIALEHDVTNSLFGWHGVIWLLGLGALGFVAKRSRRLVWRRLQAEEALQESHAHLEEQVQQRTMDLQEANDRFRAEITERKQAEETLRESDERYRNFVTHASEGIYRIDFTRPIPVDVPDEELVATLSQYAIVGEVNEALARMYKLRPEDMVGQRATDFAPEYGERAQSVVRAPQHQVSDVETRDVDKDGQSLYLSESFSAVVEDGTLVRIWGMQRDITERKQAEEALRESEERFRRFSEAAFEGIAITEEGRFIDANPRFAEMVGCKSSELVGKEVMAFVAPESREFVIEKIVSKYEKPYEHMALRRDGSIFPVEVNGKSIPYQGRTVRVTAIRDITERKKAEEALWPLT